MRKFKNILKYIVPPIITIFIILIVLALKGFYPFGNLRIEYYDNIQQVIPIYMHLWDWLHGGNVSLFFDWFTGLGTNFFMPISAFSVLSPFNLLLYLIPREEIRNFLYIFIIIKLAFMSETMYIYLNKKFKTSYIFKLLFSIMFALSGYQLQYSVSFMPWMDVIVFFPLLMLSLEKIYNNRSNIYYILFLTICFIINYYITSLMLLFIFILSGIYINFFVEKEKRKTYIFKIAIGTIVSIGLAAFILLPTIMQLTQSQRFNNNSTGLTTQIFNILKSTPKNNFERMQQYIMYANLSLPIALMIWGIHKFKKEKEIIKSIIISSIFMLIPLFVEGTNLLLHFGSYVGYNMRYGFIIIFVFLNIGCYYSSKIKIKKEKINPTIILYLIIFVQSIIILIYIWNIVQNRLAQFEYQKCLIYYENIMIIFLILFAIIYYIFFKFTKRNSYVLVLIGILHIFIFAYICFGRPQWLIYEPYQDGNYIEFANEASNTLQIEQDNLNRIKNLDLSLNSNYPLVLKRAALSSFTAAVKEGVQNACWNWGYSKYYIHLLDAGGTILSDAILNVKQVITTIPLNEELYDLTAKSKNYFLYNSKYTIPFGITTSKKILQKDIQNLNWIDLNNSTYQILTGKNENLIETIINNNQKSENVKTDYYNKYIRIIDVKVNNHSTLYLSSYCGMKIRVNGKQITVPSIGENDVIEYPNNFNNNIVELGTFNNETVKIVLYDVDEYPQICLGALDVDKMERLCDKYASYSANEKAEKNILSFKVTGSKDKNVVIIPIQYDSGWKVTINGKETKNVSNVLGIFTAIEIEDGINDIEMIFTPKGLRLGILISMLSLALLILINKKTKIFNFLEKTTEYIYYFTYGGVIITIFIIPTIYYLISFVHIYLCAFSKTFMP